jgi:DNA repair exonuclease SbcCD ATPase subunit
MGMPEKDTSKPITLRSSKEEMLAAYKTLSKELEEKRKEEQKPLERIEGKGIQKAVEEADSLSTERIAQEIGSLKFETGKILAQVSDKLENEIERYARVKAAVEAKEKELQEIYEIEKTASSLAALLEVQRQKREQFEVEMASGKEISKREIEEQRAEWEREVQQRESEKKEIAAAEKKRQERASEEYRYQFDREQKLARESFEDEKARMEREIHHKKEEMERELAVREGAVSEKEKELRDLQNKVQMFPAELAKSVNKAVQETTERLQKEASGREELLKSQFVGERNVMKTRIESLEATIKEQNVQIERMTKQLEKSYGQVQDIAVKAIEGSSNLKGVIASQQVAVEQFRKAPKEE